MQQRPALPLELSRQRDVFHQRQIGEAVDRPKRLASDKNGLIASGNAGQSRAPIDHPGDEREQRMPTGDAQVETAPTATISPIRRLAGKRCSDQLIGAVWQRSIGMKKDKHIAAAERGSGIQCRAAVARTGDHAIGEGLRQRRAAVAAAAVDHDHVGTAGPQRRECLQCGGDDRRLVEHRNDDG
jgi:hypothetical protein